MKKSVLSLFAAAALTGAALPAHATGGDEPADREGAARAAVLRAQLDVSLLDSTVDVPLRTTLNDVSVSGADTGPETAAKTALTAELAGVGGGEPVSLLRAGAADARAEVTADRAGAEATLARARLHVPGLPLLSVIELEAVSASVVCAVGGAATAEVNVPGSVRVLGKRVALSAGGPTAVSVPGVGEVRLELAPRETTRHSAAAAALELAVSVDPLNLGVAGVDGRVRVADVSCRTPVTEERPADEPQEPAETSEPAGAEPDEAEPESTVPQGRTDAEVRAPKTGPGLAATGADSGTPYLLGGAAGLLTLGAALVLLRRRRG
ncbi:MULTISPECIES: SCO1860 family LAETG-anchored protein [unclassified Streptomyces]|uniref:SCO1860 family LAETG-anchored protein n=1 Tax=unclassified Streptomyces TaxID=2593676 RepID=UPI0022B71781|nr:MULTISPECIES: SCO1860 family LAETG-anchored protein [unclassified Streptomyces]MCZ7413586.1 LPXTG cell wall anchor domain-containing protein [Streptomyces sp. WMMC897]MCZ7430581.1 LPXTG cell wall anchor domain-containing protein [Streptomyces sp. WMMC1477]